MSLRYKPISLNEELTYRLYFVANSFSNFYPNVNCMLLSELHDQIDTSVKVTIHAKTYCDETYWNCHETADRIKKDLNGKT